MGWGEPHGPEQPRESHAEIITRIIENGIRPGDIVIQPEIKVLVDEEVRADLAESVALGWRTQEEADAALYAWRQEFFGNTDSGA